MIHQGPSPACDADTALATVAQAMEVAGSAGAEMAVFPELFLPGYNSARIAALAQPSDGPWIAALCGIARNSACGLTIGYAERAGQAVHNSAVAIAADGTILAHYRKIQLYGAREHGIFTPGSGYAVFDWQGRKAALMICYDVEFAGHVAALAGMGAEILLVPTANMDPFDHVPRLTVPSQAVNHGVTILYANYCGTEGELTYCGGSVAVAANGTIAAQAGRGPATLIADLAGAPDPALLSTQGRDWRPVR